MTTPTTRRGWPVQSTTANLTPLSWITGQVLDGDTHTILDELCRRFHAEVEPIIKGHSWGWSYRPVRGYTNVWSEHAAGTAVDLNAPAHYMGLKGTFTEAQETAIRRILTDLGNVVVWGGVWTRRPDEMHFELKHDPALIRKVAAAIRAGKSAAHPEPPKESTSPIGVRDTASVVEWLAQRGRDSSFSARAKLAAQYGITGYRGTAEQNLTLLSHLRADEDGTSGTYTVNALHKDGVNVRTGPGREHPILGLAPVGTTITTTGKTSGDYAEGSTPYMLSHGQTGWMHTAHLDKKG
ncbi:M15 family metallopeptidase [Micrococcus lylae]|uniref:M15 family metallopeptidase n=1 Tax=Micrococcus lylae TaxID=1273 RepID=UPI000C801440|nr:M15 family metallopeptidase [Micrococcus lylae]WIK82180.1 M15 family metallopeptidase [Micrococcus lylae]